ncbi:hypothetical protein EJ08DRAFT_652511 [Tothia fuscella]|uniref:Uncharacterized protein n=1 Tax=Tothia fuscella TaxID=1048955 RepID=A0A9P4NJZ5_9PEZI|nr:hypothetical protein EJ08DRAFT_652511 [Tothia fuscella]
MSFPDFPSTRLSSSSSSSFSSSSSSRYSSSCQLSPHDRFLSSLITSFVGSIVTGITGGYFIAFCTAWICWFATTRILVVGVWFCKQALCGKNLDSVLRKTSLLEKSSAIKEQGESSERTAAISPPPYEEAIQLEEQHPKHLSSEDRITTGLLAESAESAPKAATHLAAFQAGPPTILGYAGWIYAAVYFPIVQIMWLIGNWPNGPSSGTLKLVRAIGVGITALPLTMDTKARYAVALEKRFGRWANRLFTYIHAFSTLILGVQAVIMLVVAAIQMPAPPGLVVMYIVLSIIWMFGSFLLFPPMDGGMSPNSVGTFVAGLAMGIFGGAFTSAASFGAMQSAAKEPGMSIGDYLSCESEVWRKFIATFP